MRVIVTGGAGFIGSAVCRHLVADTEAEVINVDKLTYAGSRESLGDAGSSPRYRFVKAYICNEAAMKSLFAQTSPTVILHLAAESHVDRSIAGSRSFIDTNIVGTYTLLETARRYWAGLSGASKESFRF